MNHKTVIAIFAMFAPFLAGVGGYIVSTERDLSDRVNRLETRQVEMQERKNELIQKFDDLEDKITCIVVNPKDTKQCI